MGRRFFFTIILTGLLSSFSLGYSGGSGTSADPYQIATKADLLALAATATDYGKYFILTADIDMGGQTFTAAIIAPDTNRSTSGFQGTAFTGTFDGNGHKITHVTINGGSNVIYLGLFGYIDLGSQIKNLGVENCTVSASSNSYYVGGLIGYCYLGSITNCYSKGSVSGYYYIGGLVGFNYCGSITNCYSTDTINCSTDSRYLGGLVGRNDYGTITGCYSTGSVGGSVNLQCIGGLVGWNGYGIITSCYSTGSTYGSFNSQRVGGLVGYNFGCINSCYSSGSVGGASSSDSIGGLVGANAGGISQCYSTGAVSGATNIGGLVGYGLGDYVTGSFWDTQTSHLTTSAGGTGKTTTLMKTLSTFTSAGWDFVNETAKGTCNYWYMPVGNYPVLAIFNGFVPSEPAGSGTEEAPYTITNANDMGTIWYRSSAHYVFAGNIDFGGITWSAAVIPAFNGVLDGKNFCVRHLSINGGAFLGLFGCVGSESQIKNLNIEDGVVSGFLGIGELAGMSFGTIINCYSTGTGTVTGTSRIGGLVGDNSEVYNYPHSGSINSCYSTAAVSGIYYVGGLAGNNDGDISRCYATGTVSGSSDSDSVGGLVGYNKMFSNISQCYSAGAVSGTSNVGGLVGWNFSGNINRCYSAGAVNGSSSVGGLVGNNENGAVSSCLWDTDTSGQTTSAGGTGKTTPDMKTLFTFTSAGWDFTNETANGTADFWRMCTNGMNYPKLNWESIDGDFACSNGISTEDLNYFIQRWLLTNCTSTNNYCGGADLNYSGAVDLADLAIFAAHWLEGI